MPVRSSGVHRATVVLPDDFERKPRITGHMQNTGMNAKCHGCEMPIFDRYIMTVLDRAWHADCLRCCHCKCPLQDKCYCRGDRLFCREDFFRVFGTKCNGCGSGICPNDLVRRTPRGDVYHLKCFICTTCRKQLSTGEELYIIGDCEFNCKDDYVISKHAKASSTLQPLAVKTEVTSAGVGSPCFNMNNRMDVASDCVKSEQHDCLSGKPGAVSEVTKHGGATLEHQLGEDEDGDEDEDIKRSESAAPTDRDCCDKDSKSVGGGDTSSIDESEPRGNDENVSTKRRGPRTTIKAKQLELLKNAFAQTPKPTRHIRDQLSQETGLTMRVIQVWFQNRRSKERRMKQQNIMGAGRRCNMFRSRRSGGRSLREFDGDSGDIISGVQGQPGFAYFPDGPGNHNMDFFPGLPGQVSPGLHPHPHGGPLGHPPGIFDFAHYRQTQNAAEAMAHFNELPPNAHGMPGNINHGVDGHFGQEMLSQSSTPNSLTPDGYGHPAFDTLHAGGGMNGGESPVWQSMTLAQ